MKKNIHRIDLKIDDFKDRYIIMKDHFWNINQEIQNT